MEEQKSNQKPVSGLAEALYPEIGNGAALENEKHAFLLRSPDPSRLVAEFLSLPNGEMIESPVTDDQSKEPQDLITSPEKELPMMTPLSHAESSKVPPSDDIGQDTLPGPEERTLQPKAVRKKKAAKPGKEDEMDVTASGDLEPGIEKRQKAGKLLRKAAKSVKRQEDAQKAGPDDHHLSSLPSLSPFSSWLKNLSGSDYVHPYEDDFAFEQASGLNKEGISETFADLLAAQGYKEQARDMYIQLMEKYPEKSGFFAAKLEALQ